MFNTRIFFTASAMFLFFAASIADCQDRADSKPAATNDVIGNWKGDLKIQGIVLELELRLKRDDKDELDGSMVSLTQGGIELPFTAASFSGTEFKFEIANVKATYVGTLSDDGQNIAGTFSQLGNDTELVFHRTEKTSNLVHKETWRGIMNAGGRDFDFQLRLFEDGDKLVGMLDSLSENLMGLNVDVDRNDNSLNFDLKLTNAQFEGSYNSDKSELKGKWIQSGGEFDLTFKKTALVNTLKEPEAKPQTPEPPFPYDSEDVTISNLAEDVQLAGTLTTPKTGGPHPIVIMISGSGAQDRDETLLGHKPFLVIADYLTRRGIAVLRYDDRGYGKSTGDFSTATSENFATDVEAAVGFAANHPKLDKTRIGLIGHSEGGLIAPMVAAREKRVAFIVLLAGPGVTGAEIIKKQTYEGSKLAGMSANALSAQRELIENYVEALLASEQKLDPEKSTGMIAKLKAAVENGSEIDKAIAAQIEVVLGSLDAPWTRFFLKYDPKTDLRKVKCPVLAVNGAKDVQVDANINLAAIKSALTEATNADFEVKKLDNLNHLFQNCETGAGSEYATIKETFAPSALKVVGDWIESHVK